MAIWVPISGGILQRVKSDGKPASGYVLKLYAPGTTTNIPLATDATGLTTATTALINATGDFTVSGNTIIPHIDQDYKLAIYPTQAAADLNSGATVTIDYISTAIGGAIVRSLYLVGETGSLASRVPSNTAVGDLVEVTAYSSTSAKYPATWKCTSISASLPASAVAGDVTGTALGALYVLKAGSTYYKFELVGQATAFAFGATGDGETDDTVAIQAAINACNNSRSLHFPSGTYICASGLTITTANSLMMTGEGEQHSVIMFTGAGSGIHMSATSCTYLSFENIGIQYNNGSFTGTLLRILNTARVSFHKCLFYGDSVVTAGNLLDLDQSIEIEISRCRFSGAAYLISGQANGGGGFCNAVEISCSDFDRYVSAAIRNPGQGWSVHGNAFEPNTSDRGYAIDTTSSLSVLGFHFAGNWLGDAVSTSAYTWIVINGTGIVITGNYINGHGSNLAIAVAINAATSGLSITGNRFSSFLTGIALGTAQVTNSIITGNSFTSVTNETTGTFGADCLTYEETDWTPELKFAGVDTGITYTSRSGKCIKMGKARLVTFDIALSSKGSATGGAGVYGLPDTSNATIGVSANIGYRVNFATAFAPECRIEDSNTIITINKGGAVTTASVADTDFNNNTRFSGSAFYFVP